MIMCTTLGEGLYVMGGAEGTDNFIPNTITLALLQIKMPFIYACTQLRTMGPLFGVIDNPCGVHDLEHSTLTC